MKVDDVRSCSFDSWYKTFEMYTQESCYIQLPDEIVKSILESEFFLPKNAKLVDIIHSDSSDNDEWPNGEESESQQLRPEFPHFEADINKIIDSFGGVVFPKLNWSAPNDATWVLYDNSLKCKNFTDIYLLLKSSDFIMHDLTVPFALCTDLPPSDLTTSFQHSVQFKPILVLKRWFDFRPDGEFRCFVKNKNLIGISQRKYDIYFKSIHEQADRIKTEITKFFHQHIRTNFGLDSYTVDLYWEYSKTGKSKITIIDFNVFGEPTEALLFCWSELEDDQNDYNSLPNFRYQEDCTIRPNQMNQYSVPIDVIHIASGSDPNKLIDFIQAKVESQIIE